MRIRPETRLSHSLQQLADALSPSHLHPHDQLIDEEPDQPLDLRSIPVRDVGPDSHVRLPAVPAHQHVEAPQQRHIQRHAFSPPHPRHFVIHTLPRPPRRAPSSSPSPPPPNKKRWPPPGYPPPAARGRPAGKPGAPTPPTPPRQYSSFPSRTSPFSHDLCQTAKS